MASGTVDSPMTDEHRTSPRGAKNDPSMPIRQEDLQPYTGLGYLSKLFKVMAIILLLLLVSEIVTGFMASGTDAIPTLLGEMSRLVVLSGLLWGSGDLALLLIDVGHDVRATRILLGRQAAHQAMTSGGERIQTERGPR